ncbi:unnamed protein product [Cochlearia groenlandica]
MAETERPHRSSSINSSNNANTPSSSSTDLFSCFTSRFSSSSSMRLSSLSPARSACLTTSLSRRLRTSGSLKNASLNSPMFGANNRKRSGSGYDNNNIEPSSPKVTCIGQVRVKTRKNAKKKKMRARSRRRGGGGDTSLRRSSFDQNDGGGCRLDASSENRWVHLPVTICESLRSFGSELNCFVPCRSSCTGNNNNSHHRDGDRDGCGGGNGCGFARWFVAVEETGGKRREIELVVGGGEEDAEEDRRRSRRRHVFEGIDLGEIATEKKEREEIGRISLCTPPKNALLLMRCRSDPVKVAALANRVRERQMLANDEEEDEERRRLEIDLEDKKRIELCEKWISGEKTVAREVVEDETPLESNPPKEEEIVQVLKDSAKEEEESAKIQKVDSFEEEIIAKIIINIEDNIRNSIEEEHIAEMEEEEEESKEVATATPNVESYEQGNREPDPSPEVMIRRNQQEEKEKKPYKVLPDSLLLMMCEPKLSMEVSKETWVCSTDFARSLPRRPPAKKIPEATGDHHHQQQQPKKRIISAVESNASSRRRSIDRPPVQQAMLQPSRSSCSYPAAPPIIAAVGEQKLAGVNKAFEPPVLPRCKSEPRKSASKLAPEACFWKNRKLEPHTPGTVGVGAAGVGF